MFFVLDRIAAKTTLRSRRCACRVSDTWNAGFVNWFSSDPGRPSHIFISLPELFLRVFTGFYCYTATLLYGLRCFYCYTESLRLERPLPGHAEYPHNYFSITVAQRGGNAPTGWLEQPFATTFRAVQSFSMFDVKMPTP